MEHGAVQAAIDLEIHGERASAVDLSAAGVAVQPRGGDLLSSHDDLVCSLFTHVLLFL